MRVERLRKRRDFIALRKRRRVTRRGFVLQLGPNGLEAMRVGVTVTKKVGNAVVRNRIKRRLRAATRAVFPDHGAPGHDYVIIAKPAAATLPFATLLDELREALLGQRLLPPGAGPTS